MRRRWTASSGRGRARAAGVEPADRVVVTARNSADFLLLWLALMEAGAIQVPINPASTPDEVRGFIRQVDPSLVVTSSDLAATVEASRRETSGTGRQVEVAELYRSEPDGRGPAVVQPEDVAVMIPTSGTTGRSKLVMQTHLAYVMAGEGTPYWLGLTADDRLMTSLPLFHINARILDARIAGGASQPGAPPGILGQRVHRHRSPARGHPVQQHRGNARDPDAPTRAARRRRQPDPALLHGSLAQS